MTSRHGWIAAVSGLLYGVFYLYAIGDLRLLGPPVWGAYVAELSLARMFSARAALMFEAVAVIEAGYVTWLVSPVNLFISALLAGLLGSNVHGVLALRNRPRACATGRGGLLASGLPALLAGGACCAPSLILLLGVPALGALGAFFGWLVPLSIVALALNRLWQRRQLGSPHSGSGLAL